MQNLVVVSNTVRAHVGGPRTLREAGALPTLDGGVADPLETRYSPTCFILPHFIALGQTVWAQVGVLFFGGGGAGARVLGTEA